jgi:hypothetical protein
LRVDLILYIEHDDVVGLGPGVGAGQWDMNTNFALDITTSNFLVSKRDLNFSIVF